MASYINPTNHALESKLSCPGSHLLNIYSYIAKGVKETSLKPKGPMMHKLVCSNVKWFLTLILTIMPVLSKRGMSTGFVEVGRGSFVDIELCS